MKLSRFQRQILQYLEPLPTAYMNSKAITWSEWSQVRLSKLATGLLRRSRSGNPLWDPWILKDGDVYRLYYLEGVEGTDPWWSYSRICGAISTDLKQWEPLGVLLEPELENAWESGRVCAGCTYQEAGTYYLFYSAGGQAAPHLHNEGIGLATSTDGIHFSRQSHQPLLIPKADDRWYTRSNWTGHFHWRDPYLFKDLQTGKYYLFICASAKIPGNFQGCIGLAVADKITGPYQILPPVITISEDLEPWAYYHMERPQVIHRNGMYYLFFSCFKQFFNPDWLRTTQQNQINNSSLYWYVSDQITGPYQPVDPKNFVVPGSERTGLYGTSFLQTSTNPETTIAYGWYHRLHTLEVSDTFRVLWQDGEPTKVRSPQIITS